MDNHYTNWGCNLANGWPTAATLASLDMDDVAAVLTSEGLIG